MYSMYFKCYLNPSWELFKNILEIYQAKHSKNKHRLLVNYKITVGILKCILCYTVALDFLLSCT